MNLRIREREEESVCVCTWVRERERERGAAALFWKWNQETLPGEKRFIVFVQQWERVRQYEGRRKKARNITINFICKVTCTTILNTDVVIWCIILCCESVWKIGSIFVLLQYSNECWETYITVIIPPVHIGHEGIPSSWDSIVKDGGQNAPKFSWSS